MAAKDGIADMLVERHMLRWSRDSRLIRAECMMWGGDAVVAASLTSFSYVAVANWS